MDFELVRYNKPNLL